MAIQTPSLQFSVMCLDLVEEEKRPPTLQYLFYELPFPSLPFQMDRFHVINCWANGIGDFKQSVKILTPSKDKVFIETGEQAFTLEDPYTPQLMINVFQELQFEEEGHYWVQNFLDGKLVLEYPLTIRVIQSAKQEPKLETKLESKNEKKPSSLPTSLGLDEWNIPK
jgi:hypothetical protein